MGTKIITANYTSNSAELTAVELTVPGDCAGLRLDQALARLLPDYSRNRLSDWVRRNLVTVDGHNVQPRQKMWGGERICVLPERDPQTLAFQPQDIPLDIIYEDATLLVINKPAGLVVHPGSGNWQGTMLNALLQHAPALGQLPRAGIVHRLDKETSGLLVVAKTLTAQTDLVRQLQAHSVSREYLAVAHGRVVRDGKVESPIGRHPVKRTRMAVVVGGKPSVTHYHVVEQFAYATLLRCRLETGRTHQIRVHLDSIGHPIFGDPVYGRKTGRKSPREQDFGRQALHAEKLGLIHPDTKRAKSWHIKLPPDMQTLISELRLQS